jgi:Zn-dependent protease with chaperone function
MAVKKYFVDISSRAWEHPADRAALTALRKIPGLDVIVKTLIGATTEKALKLDSLGSSARATSRQFARVFRLAQEACSVLDIRDMPEIYVRQSPIMNASMIGAENPFISIDTALLDVMTDAELEAVIGHELAHAASGHGLYKTLIWYVTRAASMFISELPLGNAALFAVSGALNEWNRKSELSADRAALLVTQDLQANFGSLVKTIAGNHSAEIDINELFIQADEYSKSEGLVDSLQKFLSTFGESHPIPVSRLAELQSWSRSDEYAAILDGRYPRRSEDGRADAEKDWYEAADRYRRDLRDSGDPLQKAAGAVADAVAEGLGKAGKQIEDLFKGFSGDDEDR